MTLISVRFGTNDLASARAFYDATFAALGIAKSSTPPEYPIALYQLGNGIKFIVGPARDGQPATHANGGTLLFAADSPQAVAAWHAPGLANGGTNAGHAAPQP